MFFLEMKENFHEQKNWVGFGSPKQQRILHYSFVIFVQYFKGIQMYSTEINDNNNNNNDNNDSNNNNFFFKNNNTKLYS